VPGFAIDEPADELGAALKLPEWLEPQRATIESQLAPLP
jgi:glyoxalase family protein